MCIYTRFYNHLCCYYYYYYYIFFFKFVFYVQTYNSFADAAGIVFLPVWAALGEFAPLLRRALPTRLVVAGRRLVQRSCFPLPRLGHPRLQPHLRSQPLGSLSFALKPTNSKTTSTHSTARQPNNLSREKEEKRQDNEVERSYWVKWKILFIL